MAEDRAKSLAETTARWREMESQKRHIDDENKRRVALASELARIEARKAVHEAAKAARQKLEREAQVRDAAAATLVALREYRQRLNDLEKLMGPRS